MKLETFRLSDLTPAEYNPRTITDEALKGLSKSLEKFGYLQPLVINVHGGGKTIISGHQRVKAMLAQGENEAECVVVDFDQVTEKAANIALNSEAISGDWDLDGLEVILEELKIELPDFDELNFDELYFGGEEVDNKDEWTEMPEFEQKDQTPTSQIIVSFCCDNDRNEFSKLIKQKITKHTKSLWYPEEKPMNLQSHSYE